MINMNEEKLEKLKEEARKGYWGLLFITLIIKALIVLGLIVIGTIRGILYLLKRFQ